MDPPPLLPDKIDCRPAKRQKIESPIDSINHGSTSDSRTIDDSPATEMLDEAEEQAILSNNVLLIPGLGLIKPNSSETEAHENEDKSSSRAAVGTEARGPAEEQGTYPSTLHIAESLKQASDGAAPIPTTIAHLAEKQGANSMDNNTFERPERSGALLLALPQPQDFSHPPVPLSMLDKPREDLAVKEEETVNGIEFPGQEEAIKVETLLGKEKSENVTPASHPDGVDVMKKGAGLVGTATLDDASNDDGAPDYLIQALVEKILVSKSEDHGDKNISPVPNHNPVEAQGRTAQLKEIEAVQPADIEMPEHEPCQQRGDSPLTKLIRANPALASCREQVPSPNNVEESQNTKDIQDAEWEIDSSPVDSSSESDTTSDTSSTDGSGADDADFDGDYAMLDPEEQARILMQGDGGSDDEGNNKSGPKGGTAHLRTANETPEEVVPKPDIKVTEDMKIEELGTVEATVENCVLIKGRVSGEYRVLGTYSLLCLQDRSVVGVVSETLGRVQQPLYTIRFTNDEAIEKAGLSSKNTPVYYVEQHSNFVFTQPLRAVKGSDASNFHDEEVAADEMEFSDDEAEAEHKRRLKLKKQGRKDERIDRLGHPRGRHTGSVNGSARRNSNIDGDTTVDMNYDDIPPMGDDGYTPLARPTNLLEMMGSVDAPLEGRQPVPSFSDRGHDRGRGRGRGRGDRGSRGRRGGRGRGGWDQFNNNQSRKESSSIGQQTSLVPKLEASSSPRISTNGHHQQQQPQQSHTPTFALPAIPPTSQYPYPQMPPPLQTPSFSYQNPTPPQAPTISPQPSSYPIFSPSPISPLPQTHLNFNSYASQQLSPTKPYSRYLPQEAYLEDTQQRQNLFSGGQQGQGQPQMPPPGSHINPAFFEALRQQREDGAWQSGRR